MREKGKRMKQDGICEKALWRLSSTRQWQPFFLVIFLSIFLSLFNLTGDAPLLSCMPSVITFFSYFFPFSSIYLHFFKENWVVGCPLQAGCPGPSHPPLRATVLLFLSIFYITVFFLSLFLSIFYITVFFLSLSSSSFYKLLKTLLFGRAWAGSASE